MKKTLCFTCMLLLTFCMCAMTAFADVATYNHDNFGYLSVWGVVLSALVIVVIALTASLIVIFVNRKRKK